MGNKVFEKSPLCKRLFNSLAEIKERKKQSFIPKANLLDPSKSILIFGAGAYGIRVHDILKNRYKIVAFVDNSKNKYNEVISGIPVYPPSEIARLNYDLVFIASQYIKDIHQQLVNDCGVDKEKITY
ncbi:MAG: nucleoside-diphosphate sugar epimerase/dehydratase [Aeromonas veronii]